MTPSPARIQSVEEIMAGHSQELRSRLTRGGLSPEAVDKAINAFEAGDLHSLNFHRLESGTLICPLPEELLVKVFPGVAAIPKSATSKDMDHLYLEYEINRHRGDKKSLTVRWPGDSKEAEEPTDEKPKAAPKGTSTPLALSTDAKPKEPGPLPKEASPARDPDDVPL